jgi:hypothetical protein
VRFAEGPARHDQSAGVMVARDGDHKWIAHKGAPEQAEIYDLRTDPEEKQPLEDPALRRRGEDLFRDFGAILASGAQHPKPPERKLDEETTDKLRALGYVGD